MPVSSMFFAFGLQMLLIDGLRYLQVPAPVRISSLPQGSPLRPGIYSIIEDVCAVDGGGGTEFRQRLNLRYVASHYFRRMLHRLTLFWALGALLVAGGTTAVVFTAEKNVAYVVCDLLSECERGLTAAGWVDDALWLCRGADVGHGGLCEAGAKKGEAGVDRRAVQGHSYGIVIVAFGDQRLYGPHCQWTTDEIAYSRITRVFPCARTSLSYLGTSRYWPPQRVC
jgi:hypothetical protein